jgi:hypothetical protein
VDLVERAGQLKPMLVEFALSSRFNRELSAVIAREFPGGVAPDEGALSTFLDYFAIQHRLESGGTVVEAFVAAHPELTGDERDMLLGWRDVVEGIFEVAGKERHAVVLYGFLDELTYRTRSNLGPDVFTPLEKGMIAVGRLVRAGNEWMVSSDLAVFPSSVRDQMLVAAAEQAMRSPEKVFRNPAKLAEARRILAQHRAAFVELFGSDLIVVPGSEVAGKIEELHRRLSPEADPGAAPPEPSQLGIPDHVLAADTVAIHFIEGHGLSFYSDYHLIEELFANPALVVRRRYREALSGFLRDPDASPEPLRRLAERDVDKADEVFIKLLSPKRGFSWETDGEAVLRKYKPGYFDGSQLPRSVPLSDLLFGALQHQHGHVSALGDEKT